MACTGADNVFAIPVPGTFDDAQRVVKETFGDAAFTAAVNLSAVNSINIARVLAQCVYYISAWLRLSEAREKGVEFVVPTGNFGNVLAGWLAAKMGLPGVSFRVATNQNDILHRFFSTGIYEQGEVHPSHAPSMDIQAASNFERYLWFLLGGDASKVREVMAEMKSTGRADLRDYMAGDFRSTRMDDATISASSPKCGRTGNTCSTPAPASPTAMSPDRTSVVLATASPAKFPEVVARATGTEPVHPSLEALKSLPLQRWPLAAEVDAVKALIRARI